MRTQNLFIYSPICANSLFRLLTENRDTQRKVQTAVFFGAPARSLDDITRLRRNGFDFGEIAIANAGARRMWWESGVINGGLGKFFLTAHGPLEGDPNDAGTLWNRYMPNLMASVDTLNRMSIRSLNIHLLVDRRIVSSLVLAEKIRSLKEIVEYGQKNSVAINLENLSETADDLEDVINPVFIVYGGKY